MLLLVNLLIGNLLIPVELSEEESNTANIKKVLKTPDWREDTRGPAMESDPQGGSWYDDFNDFGGLNQSENVTIINSIARSSQRAYRVPVTLVNNGELLRDFQVKININESFFDYTKAEPNGEDIRFTHENGVKLDHWIEKWNEDGNSTVWVRIPDLPEGSTTVRMYYGCPEAEDGSDGSAVFDFFDDFSFYDDAKWVSTGTSSVNNGYLTVRTGAVYSRNTASNQPGKICEAKLKWNNFAHFSGLCMGSTHSTQGSNAGSDKIVYLMTNMGGDPSIRAWAGSGDEATYDIISGATQYTATQGVEHTMGFTLTDTNLSFQMNSATTNNYIGTWSGPFYIWLGFFTGSRGGNTDISDVSVDRVMVRKIGENPETIFGQEEQNPSSYMISQSISLPDRMRWEFLTLAKTETNDSKITVSILNAATNSTIAGFDNITGNALILSNLSETEIQLKAVFNGSGPSRSTMGSWGIEWVDESAWRDSFIGGEKIDRHRGVSVGNGRVKLDHWRYRRPIEISYAGENLNDFQLMIPFNNTYFDHSKAKSAGEDIRFYDEGGYELPYWIEHWNLAGYSKVWINKPSIRNGSSIIWMYYGNPDAERKSNGELVFDFFDDFNGYTLNLSKWNVPDNTGWSIVGGRLKGTNNNGRILSKAKFSNPIVQEVKTRISTRPPNGFQGAGFYSSNNNCFGYLCHPGGDWLRNEGSWVFLGAEHVGLNQWHDMRITAKSATQVNIDIKNFETGADVYNQDFTNAVWNERIALGRRSDDSGLDQAYEAYWEYVRARKFASVEPLINIGDEYANPAPFISSIPISLPENMLWSTLSLNKTEPGSMQINLSVIDSSNRTIKGFENLTNSTMDIDRFNDLNLSEIRLKVHYFGTGIKLPILNSWSVNWSGILAPRLLFEIPDMEIQEDTTEANILNLTTYILDIYKDRGPTVFALEYVSDTQNISLAINDSILHLHDLRTNWLGFIEVVVNCTNYYDRSTLSNHFNITVMNVNDPPVVELLSPLDRSVIAERSVTLSWNATDIDNDLADLSYDIYFSDDPSVPLYKSGVKGLNYTIDSLEDGKRYFWYVIPHDRERNGTCINHSNSFTVSTAALILLLPENGAILNATGIDLKWHLINTNEAWKKYHIYMGSTSKDLLETNVTYDEYFSINLPNINDTYFWKIIAEIGDTNRSIESEVWSFSTKKVFVPVHDIKISFTEDRVSGFQSSNITVELNISNRGNVKEEIIIEIIGELAGKVGHEPTILLAPGQQIFLTMKLKMEYIKHAKVYLLQARATYSGESTEAELEVDIALEQSSLDIKSSSGWVWITIAILFILVIVVILLLIIRRSGKKKKERLDPDIDIPETEKIDKAKETNVKAAGFAAVESQSSYTPYSEISNMEAFTVKTHDDFGFQGGITPPAPAETRRYDYRKTRTGSKKGTVDDGPRVTDGDEEKTIVPEIEVLPPKPMEKLESFLKSSRIERKQSLPTAEIDVPTLLEPPSTEDAGHPTPALPEFSSDSYPEPLPSSYEDPPFSTYEPPSLSSSEDSPSPTYEPPSPSSYEDPQSSTYEPPSPSSSEDPSSPTYEPPSPSSFEEPPPTELDDFTGIDGTDTMDDEVSPLSSGDNVLDAFSKYLEKMPDYLPPSDDKK